MRKPTSILALVLLTGASPAPAGPQPPCHDIFLAGRAPVANPKMTLGSVLLCNEGSAVLTSVVSRGAIWAAEHLTSGSIAGERSAERTPSLHADARLPPEGRAEEVDYRDATFVAAPLASPEDVAIPEGRTGATALSNVVPMGIALHGRLWPMFEDATRHLAAREDELFVVTGSEFGGAILHRLNGRVLVPSGIWKAIYDPAGSGMAGAWLCRNAGGTDCRIVSIDRLVSETGIDPFPSLPAALRISARGLPQPGSPLNSGFPTP